MTRWGSRERRAMKRANLKGGHMTDEESGYIDADTEEGKYQPATRPGGDIPGGSRVRFEREGEHENFLGGGGAKDIEDSILRSTDRNANMIGYRIVGVSDIVGAMGSGTVQEIELRLQHPSGQTRNVRITGIGI